MLFREVIANDLRFTPAPAQIATYVLEEFGVVAWSASTQGVALDVLVQQLVGLELRAVAGQEEQPDSASLRVEPNPHGVGAVRRVLVDDHVAWSANLAFEALEELQEHCGREPFAEYHEEQLSFVRDGRDHFAVKAPIRCRDHGSFAPGAERASRGMVRAQPHLITRALGLGPDRGIFLLEGAPDGLLRREAPGGELTPRGPHGQRDAQTLRDQLGDRFPRPEVKKLQLLELAIADQPHDYRGLCGPKPSPARGPAWASGFECRKTAFPGGVRPRVHRAARHPKELRHLALGFAGAHRLDRLAAQRGLRLRRTNRNV